MLQHAPQHRGLATSTDSTYKYAKIYFGIWGLTNDIDSFDDLIAQNREDILCAKDTWFQFGTWLHSTGRHIQNQKKKQNCARRMKIHIGHMVAAGVFTVKLPVNHV